MQTLFPPPDWFDQLLARITRETTLFYQTGGFAGWLHTLPAAAFHTGSHCIYCYEWETSFDGIRRLLYWVGVSAKPGERQSCEAYELKSALHAWAKFDAAPVVERYKRVVETLAESTAEFGERLLMRDVHGNRELLVNRKSTPDDSMRQAAEEEMMTIDSFWWWVAAWEDRLPKDASIGELREEYESRRRRFAPE